MKPGRDTRGFRLVFRLEMLVLGCTLGYFTGDPALGNPRVAPLTVVEAWFLNPHPLALAPVRVC